MENDTVQIDPTVEPHVVRIYEQAFVRRSITLLVPVKGGIPEAWRVANHVLGNVRGGESKSAYRNLPEGVEVEIGPYIAVNLTPNAADEFGEVEGMSARWARTIHSVSRPFVKRNAK